MSECTVEFRATSAIDYFKSLGRRVLDGFNDQALSRSIFNYLGKVTLSHFCEQRSPSGEQWEELSPVTTGNRRTGDRVPRRGARHKALQDDGALYRSLLPREAGADAIRETSRDELHFGTNVPHAGVHQEGAEMTVTPRQHGWMLHNLGVFKPVGSTLRIPQREFLGLNEEYEGRLRDIVSYWAVEGGTQWS